MKEFQINQFLSLRLEEDKTVIYVHGKRFRICKYLLLNVPVDQLDLFDNVDSIDDISKKLDHLLEEGVKLQIRPLDEFWAHGSNLQVWFEHDYDTRLIHSNLAFPLLRELCKVGDSLAKSVFREEIAKRFVSGNAVVVDYLVLEGYLEYLPQEYLDQITSDGEFLGKLVPHITDKRIFKFTLMRYLRYLKRGKIRFDWLNLEIICKVYEEIYDSHTTEENENDFLDGIEIFLWSILKREIDKYVSKLKFNLVTNLFKLFDNNIDYDFILENQFLNNNIVLPLIKQCFVEKDFNLVFLEEFSNRLNSDDKVYSIVNLLYCYIKFSEERSLSSEVRSLIFKVLYEENLSKFSNFIRLKLLILLNHEDLRYFLENNELNLLEKILLASKEISYEDYNWSLNELKEYNYSGFLEWRYELFERLSLKIPSNKLNSRGLREK